MKLAVALSSLGVASATSASARFVEDAALRGWRSEGPVSDTARVELTFAVRQQNQGELLKIFHEVSDPDHASYGKHLSFDQVNALTAPAQEDVNAVEAALRDLGASDVRRTVSGDFVVADVSVADAEKVFGGDFVGFRHEDGRVGLRNPHAALPTALAAAVDFIHPLNEMLSHGGPLKVKKGVAKPDALINTPSSLRKLYSVGDAKATAKGNKQGFTGFLEQYWTNVDLQEFNTLYNRAGLGKKPSKQVGDGKSGGIQLPGVEAELDVQYIMSMGLDVETEFWSFAGRNPESKQNEPFLKFMTTLGNTSDAPLIISSSYGEDEDSMTIEYQQRCNVEFQKAGVRGISLLFASGDSGVGADFKCPKTCEAGSQGKSCLQAMWPAASPYVTAVGGTGGFGKETGAGLSSGGFSYRWPTPTWQKDAVAKFLQTNATAQPDPSLYAKNGRGFPDISAQAIDFMVVAYGVPMPVAGTSAACPTAAGILSLVNDRRLQAKKAPLGFMNPLLYKNAAALNDIVGGSNPGCSSDGFTAVEGWDPVTGLGTPNFEKLAGMGDMHSVIV